MNKKWMWFLVLQACMAFFSLGGVFSKFAAREEFLSGRFFLLYGGVLAVLALYSLAWQQILKHLPLTMAYSNKAMTILWGMLYGSIFFGESYRFRQFVAAGIIIVGIVFFVRAEKECDDI